MKVPEFFGRCFDVTWTTFCSPGTGVTDEGRLCHGLGYSNIPGREGHVIKHAWIEQDRVAFDCVWSVQTPALIYRHDLKIFYFKRYTRIEALFLNRHYHSSGPWDERILREAPDVGGDFLDEQKREVEKILERRG